MHYYKTAVAGHKSSNLSFTPERVARNKKSWQCRMGKYVPFSGGTAYVDVTAERDVQVDYHRQTNRREKPNYIISSIVIPHPTSPSY